MIVRETLQRVVVVTGGARGIGLEIAKQFATGGYRVAILDLNADKISSTDLGFEGEAPETLKFVKCDLTKASEAEAAIRDVAKEFGSLDVLVNNAGWTLNAPFMEVSEADTDRIVAINFLAVLYCTRASVPLMKINRWGRIINIASDAARVGTPREAIYAGAKAGVIGFAKSLSAEVAGDGITVNVICPATTDTPLLHEALSPEQIARRAAANPTKRIGTVDDVAKVTLFFASDAASYVNGQVLSVSGGITRVG